MSADVPDEKNTMYLCLRSFIGHNLGCKMKLSPLNWDPLYIFKSSSLCMQLVSSQERLEKMALFFWFDDKNVRS